MSWTINWHHGASDTAPTAGDLLLDLSYKQKSSAARDNIRAALAWRCHVVFGVAPDISAADEEFLADCSRIGLFDLQVS